ncbi:MAG TPA: hypothetical protein VLN59_07595, partial [Burkholderiales bacterium]|nr:hypothetical protein [Burkholderiales bacterium]
MDTNLSIVGPHDRPLTLQLFFGIALLAALAWANAGAADAYPTKAIRLIVPYPPGGGVDGAARVLA